MIIWMENYDQTPINAKSFDELISMITLKFCETHFDFHFYKLYSTLIPLREVWLISSPFQYTSNHTAAIHITTDIRINDIVNRGLWLSVRESEAAEDVSTGGINATSGWTWKWGK